MAATPKKLVHWQMGTPSFSNLNSPFFEGSSETSMVSTSSLEYINSQLVAHGFAPPPGINLDGISNDDSARVVKCLLSLLSQRVDDMTRTENLTAKFRTLSYDYERLRGMHRTATEKAANAEREMNLHKSRLIAASKTMQSMENAHKQTSAELQRTRTLLQGVRATHVTELKKKEKEVERIMEKWQKLSDSQLKISSTQSGMICTNLEVVDPNQVIGKGQGFLDIALEQAEQARSHLSNENLFLRKLVLKAVNEMQTMLHQACGISSGSAANEEPTPMTMTALFPLAPADNAKDQMNVLLSSFQDVLSTLSEPTPCVPAVAAVPEPTTAKSAASAPDGEVEKLQGMITKLKQELARSQKQSMAQMTETQAMFDKFAEDHRIATGEIAEMSVELMSVPLQDEAKCRLDQLRQELDAERQKFTDAAIKFGKDKAALEAERIQLMEEKRSWEVEKLLAELPPTPMPESPRRAGPSTFVASPRKSPHKAPRPASPHKSPRKSPIKSMAVGKVGKKKKSHRSSSGPSLGSPQKVIYYETELIPPPIPAPLFPALKPLAPSNSLLPTSFVLPPPSPGASFPTRPALLHSLQDSPPELPERSSTTPDLPPTLEVSPPPDERGFLPPLTPEAAPKHPFPVAKPFAQRMIHAYSPARPSPLSRILMLADSPLTPPNLNLLNVGDISLSPTPLDGGSGSSLEEAVLGIVQPRPAPPPPAPAPVPQMSLAEELGVSESPPDTPLQEKKLEPNVVEVAGKKRQIGLAPAGKGASKASPTEPLAVRKEKENSNAKPTRGLAVKPGVPAANGASRKVTPPSATGRLVSAKPSAGPAKAGGMASAAASKMKIPVKPAVPVPGVRGGC